VGDGLAAALRIEVFVADLDAFVDFYVRVLAFDLTDDRRTDDWPYAAVSRDGVRIGAARPWRDVDRTARDVPTGVEIVIEVDDVHADRARVTEAGWPLSAPLQQRPWGLTDFRVHDPDGHYLRITSRG
jgi:lactoylglutathione lyase